MFENPRRGRQVRNFTTNVPKILDLKSSSEQIFYRKLPLGAPVRWRYCNWAFGKQLWIVVCGCKQRASSGQFQFSHRRSFDRPACLQTKKILGEGSLQGNSFEEWSKNTTKHEEVNYMSSCSTRVWDDWLKNGTPYPDSDTFVEP